MSHCLTWSENTRANEALGDTPLARFPTINLTSIHKLARKLGIEASVGLDPATLVPEQRIRDLCYENKCGNYRNHYMCPPHVGSLEDAEARIRGFRRGVLLQFSESLDVRNDRAGVVRAKTALQLKVIELEEYLKARGAPAVWGMMGGSCSLCEVCKAATDEPCPYPDRARTSLESLGIDVVALLARHGLDSAFRPDRITWTGCILF